MFALVKYPHHALAGWTNPSPRADWAVDGSTPIRQPSNYALVGVPADECPPCEGIFFTSDSAIGGGGMNSPPVFHGR